MSSQTVSMSRSYEPGGDDDVIDFGHLGEVLGDLDQLVALAADADHRHLVEAELERVGHADDLEDAALDEPVRPSADGGLGDPEVGRDLGERATPVGLEVLDDPLVERGDVVRSATGDGATSVAAEKAGSSRRDASTPFRSCGRPSHALRSSSSRAGASASIDGLVIGSRTSCTWAIPSAA